MKQLLVLLCLTLLFASACEDGCGGRQPDSLYTGSLFAFAIYDEATGENVFPNRFDPLEFEIVDNRGDTVEYIDTRRDGVNGLYSFFVRPAYQESFTFDQRFRRIYYLHFDDIDTDTLEIFFVPRDGCQEYMDDFEAYYNEELVFEGSGKSSYETNITKK